MLQNAPLLRFALATATLGTLACDLSTAPLTFRQDLQLLEVQQPGVGSASDGFITVAAVFEQPGDAISRADRVEATLVTSGGDLESVPLGRRDCPVSDGLRAVCNGFVIQLREGETQDAIAATASLLDVRLNSMGFGRFYSARAFGSWTLALNQMRTHPAVALVEYDWVSNIVPLPVALSSATSFAPGTPTYLHAAIALNRAPPRRRDGQLSIASGETITLRVRNSDGSEWSAQHTVP